MAARVLDGREPARQWRLATAERLAALRARGVQPGLAVVRVGDDPGSVSYARALAKTFESHDCGFRLVPLAESATTAEVTATLAALNADSAIHGILLQEPLPEGLDAEALALAIDPAKDLDGVHPANAGCLFQGRPGGFVPATALGGLELLLRSDVPLSGRRAVVIGRSTIVGRPMALLLLHRHATVTIAHSRTAELPALARQADILVAAVGRAGFVTPEMVQPGAVVVDFGINFVDGQMCGDVAPEVATVAGALTPTPGGTGAMTNAALLANLAYAAEGFAAG